jgi:pimeloyl-ACP methyl ester carboxylesterase
VHLGKISVLFVAAGAFIMSAQPYPAPGRLVDIGDRKLHLYCTGKGGPLVVLVAGGGAYSIDWALVQPRVAEVTRVCSYDRAGLGWSDSGPADETVEQTVADLHAVLKTAGEKGPYILTGASIGGIYIRAYQRAFPDEIAGLVFTNSSNRVGMKVEDHVDLLWKFSEEQLRSVFPLPQSPHRTPPAKIDEPFDRLPSDLQPVRLWLDTRLHEASERRAAGPESTLSWRKEFLREFEETDAKEHPLGNLAVVVVSSGTVANDAERRSRDGAAARLDFLSSNTMHVTATGSGHEIHLYQPDRVIEALRQTVSAIRNRAPLN